MQAHPRGWAHSRRPGTVGWACWPGPAKLTTAWRGCRATSKDVSGAALAGDAASQCPFQSSLKPLPRSGAPAWRELAEDMWDRPSFFHRTLAGRPLVLSSFFLQPALLLNDVEVARELLSREGEDVTTGMPASLIAVAGESSLVAVKDVERHRFLRCLLAVPFGRESVDESVPQLQQLIGGFLEQWAERGSREEAVNCLAECKSMTLKVIAAWLLGELPQAELQNLERLFAIIMGGIVTPVMIDLPPFPFHYAMKGRGELLAMLSAKIAAARQQVESMEGSSGSCGSGSSAAPYSGVRGQGSLLAQLVRQRDEDGRGLSDQEIMDNLIFIIFAGYETSASTSVNCLHLLAQHPRVMKRMREEQRQVVQQHGEQVTGALLRTAMPYTEAVMREVLRVRSTASSVFRTTTRDLDVHGHHVPQGTLVEFTICEMHMNDSRFASETGALAPDRFAPERFLSEQGRKQGEQMPFGAGNRTCPGSALAQAEVVTFLALLARGYKFTADWNVRIQGFPIPGPADGLRAVFRKL